MRNASFVFFFTLTSIKKLDVVLFDLEHDLSVNTIKEIYILLKKKCDSVLRCVVLQTLQTTLYSGNSSLLTVFCLI